MKKNLLKIAPVVMLALAACNNSETPADGEDAAEIEIAGPVEMPAPIVNSDAYRCGDGTILHIDFFGRDGKEGAKSAASIRIGDKNAPTIRVEPAKPEAPEEGEAEDGASDTEAAAPTWPMTSTDGETTLSGEGASIQVTLPNKGALSCKA